MNTRHQSVLTKDIMMSAALIFDHFLLNLCLSIPPTLCRRNTKLLECPFKRNDFFKYQISYSGPSSENSNNKTITSIIENAIANGKLHKSWKEAKRNCIARKEKRESYHFSKKTPKKTLFGDKCHGKVQRNLFRI